MWRAHLPGPGGASPPSSPEPRKIPLISRIQLFGGRTFRDSEVDGRSVFLRARSHTLEIGHSQIPTASASAYRTVRVSDIRRAPVLFPISDHAGFFAAFDFFPVVGHFATPGEIEKPSDSPTIPGPPFGGSELPKVSPFAIPREASFVAVGDFAHGGAAGGDGRAGEAKKKMTGRKMGGSVL